MSGPYRFTHESARSPLDRRAPAPAPASQPVSYKTNVNRAKTKKWVEAKKNAYDGDDWGDYDEYDEYGADQPAVPAMPPPGPKGYGQRFDQPARSFTDPRQQGAPLHSARRNSFEAGEEQRAFSASMTQSPQDEHGQRPFGTSVQAPEQSHHAYRQPSGAESDVSDTPQHRKDFNPSALPPPLSKRVSTAPTTTSAPPPNSQFPPRKSSIGQVDSPAATSPRGRAPSNPSKPLPFIRPSDIYKRHEEEKQRASMESSRPSGDSLDAASSPPSKSGEVGKSSQPLEAVAERRNEHLPDPNAIAEQPQATQGKMEGHDKPASSQSWLPSVEGLSSFDSDFWQDAQKSQNSTSTKITPVTGDQELRNVVDQAFVRTDEQRSVPPTPISKSDSGVSRSNTDSTAGISPIMSRVPSGATAALKIRNQNGDGNTPVIIEEAGERPPTGNARSAVSSPGHSRNISSSSLPLATPTSVESPARSPVVEPQKNVPEPESAQLTTLASPVSDASVREADIASAVLKNPHIPASELGALEKDSQKAFLTSHEGQPPLSDALPRSRSESPSKGRVQELAGKFGDVSPSRRGSANSLESWEKSRDNSRPSSPIKASVPSVQEAASRPIAEREPSFRPKLPGQWESYATSAATPYDTDKELGNAKDAGADNQASSLQEVDLTPTTAKHPVTAAESSDPLKALKAAGAAAAEALQASFGSQSSQNPTRDIPHGDVLPRPLLVERTPSAVSSIPPTPPAKDTPASEEPPPVPPLKEKALISDSRRTSGAHGNIDRPAIVPQLSMDPSAEDHESDRLRKEIVASLTPKRSSADPTEQPSLQPSPPAGRESSVFPSEYDSYFAGVSPEATKVSPEPSAVAPPSLLNRFSWENQGSTVPPVSQKADAQPNVSSPSVEPVDEPNQPALTEKKVEGNAGNIADGTVNPISPPAGLHVVNSALSPEAVDLPPRLSAEASPLPKVETPTVAKEEKTSEKPNTPLLTSQADTSAKTAQSPTAKSPTSDKPLGFRDIINIKSSSDRIVTFNQTREYWAHADHGLNAWISATMDANPELASFSPSQPARAPSKIRHRPTGSISLFGKHHGSQQAEQGSASSPQTHGPSTSSSFYGGGGSRNPSLQMQAKGKDLLHTAGVLGGKGMTGAKGLFAKGKSRFKSDKAHHHSPSETSSREASEEPELVSTITPDRHGRMSVIETTPTDSPILREDKKARRRFSSPFHRSSRSRSRPSSIILPSSFLFDFSNNNTPKNTPPRETGPVPPECLLSNSTYQAPDGWNVLPEDKTTTTSDEPRDRSRLIAPTPERLGVLPSPAKSAYSFVPHGREDDEAPPVPRIPTQRLIESVVRYSTPELEKWKTDGCSATQSIIHPAFRDREGNGNVAVDVGDDDDDDDDDGEIDEVDQDDLPPQLSHDPIPAKPHDSLALGRVSPAVSSVGANRLSVDEGSVMHGQPDGFLLGEQRHVSMGDVSPMFPPANLTLGGQSDEASQLTGAPAAFRAAYETELIGGDVSPISRQATTDVEGEDSEEEEGNSAMEKAPTAMTSPVTVGLVLEPAPSLGASPLPSQDGPAPAHAAATPGQGLEMDDAEALTPRAADHHRPRFTERLSATRLQVVHAQQQYFAPSHSQSSFETLDQDTDGSLFDDKLLDADVDPVPQPPPPMLNERGPQGHQPSVAPPPQPKQQSSPPVMISITKSPTLTNPAVSDKPSAALEQSPPTEMPPETNKQPSSLLSRLSSMVSSDAASASLVPSQHYRSSPPRLVNRQHAVSPAKISRTPAQIVEEQTTQLNRNAASDDDFDLYADQDGVVKGVRDESGQPLRIASPEKSASMQHHPPAGPSNPPATQSANAKPTEEDSTRYSVERPMSFVSGPRDSNGRPQDQINRPSTANSERGDSLLQRTPQSKSSNGAAYAASPLGHQVQRTNQQPTPYPVRSRDDDGVSASDDPRLEGQLLHQAPVIPQASSSAVSPGQFGPALNDGQQQMRPVQSVPPNMQDSRLMQDPRLVVEAGMRAARLGSNHSPAARFEGQNLQQNPTTFSHHSGATRSPPQGSKQQVMAQQLTDPRFYQNQQQHSGSSYAEPTSHPPKKEEKPSSRPKIPSVFKNIGKSHTTTPSPPPQQPLQPPQPDDRRLSASGTSSLGSGRRSASHQSYVGELPEHVGPKKERKSGTFSLFPSRPESMGTASHLSHDSTQAQPADSRFNLTSPDLPPNFVGIPPQRPPTGSLPESRPSQDPRFSALSSPQPVKKKRFSALGNLFSRNKDDKKAAKAKKHNTLPPMQSGQPWPPQQQQQQQHFRPQHQSLQYGQHPAGHPFPAMQNVPVPIVSPISPQGVSTQTMHQQAMQSLPPGLQQQLHQPYQQQLSQGYHQQHLSQPTRSQVQQQQLQQQLPFQEGSAYIDTQRRVQQHQSTVPTAQRPPENIGVTGIPLNHQHPSVNQSGGTAQAPPGEYYISETKLPDHRHGMPQTSAQQIFHPSQQQRAPTTQPPTIQDSLNHQSATHHPNSAFADSQRRQSPIVDEPRYDTPAIPAAYPQVSGAYVSPNVEEPPPPPPNAQSRDRHPSLGYYNRQNSEPQMHPLSPQVSALTQAPFNRHNSESSSVSLISPISNSPPNIANPVPMQSQKPQNPKMSSITEQSHAERTWNLNLPEGATEQEIVRAHQKQYIEQQLLAQEQLYAERTGRSPSPRSNTTQSPSPRPGQQQFPHPLSQNGGFRELMPRSSPQPYPRMQQALHPRASSDMLDPEKEMLARTAAQSTPSPARTASPSYPHSASPSSVHAPSLRSRVPSPQPSPVPSHVHATYGSMGGNFTSQQVQSPQSQYPVHRQSPRYEEHVAPHEQYWSPTQHEAQHPEANYEHSPPTDQPPPYSGPALPHDGMEKDRQDRHRPPNIVTNTDDQQGRYMEARQRQISLGMLQHPQPASMAASPSPSSADMGAEILRRQLLHQEETERQELLRRAQTQREESIRERQERTKARERARMLERSVSGGERVPSLKNDIGSARATASGWERRRGSTSRPVFELSAEDDEPVMRATSFPGQEWVPTWTED